MVGCGGVKDAERKKATALKNADKKERERAMREEEVTITVNFAGRSTVSITVPLTCTVGNLRKLLAVKMSMAVSQSVRIVLSFNGRVISDNPRRLLYGLQIADGATLDGEIAEKKKKSMASDSNALRIGAEGWGVFWSLMVSKLTVSFLVLLIIELDTVNHGEKLRIHD
eukprot:Skav208580  [mRNA]  locus=scaffold3325:51813:54899:+ [translate_table: standard]